LRFQHIVVALFFIPFLSEAQTTDIADVQFSKTDTVGGAYNIGSTPHLFISSGFGSSQISKTASLDSISGFRITEIVLVYSRYHKKEDFNQTALNQMRWTNLLQTYPSLFQNGTTVFKNVCQDVAADTSAKKLTHGFYIYFENPADSLTRKEEITRISEWIGEFGVDVGDTASKVSAAEKQTEAPVSDSIKKSSRSFSLFKTKDPKACRQPYYENGSHDLEKFFQSQVTFSPAQKRKPKELFVEVRIKLDERGIIRNASMLTVNKSLVAQIKNALYKMKPWHPAVRDGKIIKTDVKFDLYCNEAGIIALKGGVTVPVYLSKCPFTPDEELFDFSEEVKTKSLPSAFQVEDNTIVEDVVKRTPQLNNLLIVVDLTGSMSPYIAQVVNLMSELLVKNNPHVSAIALFNDGDSKSDKSKEIGKTGGIYLVKGEITMDKLGKSILRAMKNGSGGDCMENNVEALIKGINECPECNEVIMIADNFATPRDMSLIAEIKKPVHWIVCGAGDRVNVHYLDLIRANAGILHTVKSDVINLHLVKEDETIVIDNKSYKLVRGKFKSLNER